MTQRFQKHPFLALFDGPDTNSSTESRRASTVPQQALFALNDPWVDDRARALGRRVLRNRQARSARVCYLHQLVFNRQPSCAETQKCARWIDQGESLAAAAGVPAELRDEEAWTSLARVILASNEFIYVD
jgi:hypothetical protein